MHYYNKTYNHPNPIKRFAHQSRIKFGISLLTDVNCKSKVIDFGCGKGYFINELRKKISCEVIGYDKFMELENDFVTNSFSEVDKIGYYDFFTCFETLEHCHPPEQRRILKLAHNQLKDTGRMIISVPIEIGPISLLKNFMRRKTRDASFPDFTISNILKTAFYRPTTWHRDSLDYPGHFGWDHRKLEEEIKALGIFTIEKKKYSPISFFPSIWINSQVFYVLHKNNKLN